MTSNDERDTAEDIREGVGIGDLSLIVNPMREKMIVKSVMSETVE